MVFTTCHLPIGEGCLGRGAHLGGVLGRGAPIATSRSDGLKAHLNRMRLHPTALDKGVRETVRISKVRSPTMHSIMFVHTAA